MSRLRLAGWALAALGVVALVVGVVLLISGGDSAPQAGGGSGGSLGRELRSARRAQAPFGALTEADVHVGQRLLHVVVADDESERGQGLRRRSDIGSYQGMLFVFPAPSSASFTMSTVPVPLDIGFYDAGGRLVDRLRMAPCAGTESQCPLYRPSGAFLYALETLADGLPEGSLH